MIAFELVRGLLEGCDGELWAGGSTKILRFRGTQMDEFDLTVFRSGRGGQRVGSELLPLNHAAILNSTEKSRRA